MRGKFLLRSWQSVEDVVINLFPNFTLWKLHSFKQYALFFLVIVTGIVIFYTWTQQLKRKRTPEAALERTVKRLKSVSRNQAQLFIPGKKTVLAGDLVAVLPKDIVLLQIIHWGYSIQGSYHSEQWTLADNSESRKLPNPLLKLQKDKERVEKALAEPGTIPMAVHCLVVFADNYAEPNFKLDDASLPYVTSVKGLKEWIRKRELQPAAKDKLAPVLKAVSHIVKEKE